MNFSSKKKYSLKGSDPANHNRTLYIKSPTRNTVCPRSLVHFHRVSSVFTMNIEQNFLDIQHYPFSFAEKHNFPLSPNLTDIERASGKKSGIKSIRRNDYFINTSL